MFYLLSKLHHFLYFGVPSFNGELYTIQRSLNDLYCHVTPCAVRVCIMSCFSRVWLFATLWTITCQPSLLMGFSRQEYWNGLLCPLPRDLLHPGIGPTPLRSPALADRFHATGLPRRHVVVRNMSANARDIRDEGWIPVSGRSPGGGHGNPLQYSCLENPMGRGPLSHGQRTTGGL